MHKSPRSATRLYTQQAEMLQELKKRAIKEFQIELAHRLHAPQKQPLPDLGFSLFPELGKRQEWVSETIFGSMFASFIVWSFSPFFFRRKRFYTAVLYSRLLMVLCMCQSLRIISFLSTSLPSPNYHCRAGEPTAIREPAQRWWDHIFVDVGRQSTHGCGDLIFSSHTTFALHYTVDVVVAYYTVPLVFYTALRRWTTKRPKDEWMHRPAIDPLLLGGTGGAGREGGGLQEVVLVPMNEVVNAADRTVIKGGGIAAAKEVGLPPRGPTMRTRTTGAFTAMSGADDVETATLSSSTEGVSQPTKDAFQAATNVGCIVS